MRQMLRFRVCQAGRYIGLNLLPTWSLFTLAFLVSGYLECLKAQDFSADNSKRVSQGTYTGATESTGSSIDAAMSKNGRFVAFESVLPTSAGATNPDFHLDGLRRVTRGRRHVYLYDRQADSLELASLTLDGAEAPVDCYDPAVSNDGRYVAFVCETLQTSQVETMVEVCGDDDCHLNRAYGGTHVYIRDRKSNWTLLATQVEVGVASKVQFDFRSRI